MSANQKRLIAYAICSLLSIIFGGATALVVGLLSASTLASAGAFGGGFVSLMGIGVAVIGPFDFTYGNDSLSQAREGRAHSVTPRTAFRQFPRGVCHAPGQYGIGVGTHGRPAVDGERRSTCRWARSRLGEGRWAMISGCQRVTARSARSSTRCRSPRR